MDYYDYSGITATEATGAAALGGVFIVIMLILFAFCLAIAILTIIGQWRVLKKGNQPGWAALIPFYNTYCFCKMTGLNPWWVLISALAPGVLSLIPFIGSLAGAVVSIYFAILLGVSLARCFGKEDVWAVGIILLAPIFFLLLGRQKEQYLGPKPMHDIVFDDWFKQNQNANVNNNAAASNNVPEAEVKEDNNQSRFCPSCGAKIEGDTKFCPGCGKEV